MFVLGRRSKQRLRGVHPDLVAVVERAITLTPVDFTVLEGLRDEARQRELVAAGASRTMRSRHLTGHAVDLGAWVGGQVSWDWPLYHHIARAMFDAADNLGVAMRWGGNWGERYTKQLADFADGPHYELARRVYAGDTLWSENSRNKVVTS
jgi:peptidoglycan L-alanyl-D-glutamate endopeptidase CwlK